MTHYDTDPEYNQAPEVTLETPDSGTLPVLSRAEVATAKQFPRSIQKFTATAVSLATLSEEVSRECIYALPPRDGKIIEGPSARFAEIIAYAWGNCRSGARQVGEDQDYVRAQGVFLDLERNVGTTSEVSRRITNKKNKRYSTDMIAVTSNAACSIAIRNAVLKGIPKACWKPIYDRARQVVAGDARTLATRRTEAVNAFQIFGATPAMVFSLLCVQGIEDITVDHIVTLRGIITSLREGDVSAEEVFGSQPKATSVPVAAAAVDMQDDSTNQAVAPVEGVPLGDNPQGASHRPPRGTRESRP
jgi:hypothetical protein